MEQKVIVLKQEVEDKKSKDLVKMKVTKKKVNCFTKYEKKVGKKKEYFKDNENKNYEYQ